jgi:hypothetical protein
MECAAAAHSRMWPNGRAGVTVLWKRTGATQNGGYGMCRYGTFWNSARKGLRTNWSSLVYFRISEMKDHIKWIHHCRRWRSSRIRNEKLGSEGGSFLRDWLWLTGLMHWSVRGSSCFASCSNRRVPYRSLRNPTEAEGLRGLVRSVRYVQYCT